MKNYITQLLALGLGIFVAVAIGTSLLEKSVSTGISLLEKNDIPTLAVGGFDDTFIPAQLATTSGVSNGDCLTYIDSTTMQFSSSCGSGGGGGSGVGWAVSSGTTTLYSSLNIPVIITDTDQTATASDSVLDVWGDVTASYFTASSTTGTSTLANIDTTQLLMNGDYITDFTGTNLSVTNGVLSAAGGGGSGSVGTSTADVDTYVTYFTSNSATPATIGAEAAFTYDDSTNILSADNVNVATQLEIGSNWDITTESVDSVERLLIQGSGANAVSELFLQAKGSSDVARITLSADENTNNYEFLEIDSNGTNHHINSSSTGSGTTLPFSIQMDSTDIMSIATDKTLDFDQLTTNGILQVTGGDGSVSASTTIAAAYIDSAIARDSELHDAVTVSGTPNYITLSGQDIVRAKLDLPDDINTFTEAQLETAVSDDNPLFDGDIGGSVQAQDAVLDDLSALTAVADNEFIVGTGAGTYGHESGSTALTSLENGAINVLLETEIDASSELLALMDDETGTGALMFGTSPTITTDFTFDGTTVTALSGADTTIITGTAGTSGNCVEWNADGDIVDAGDVCGSGGGSGSLSTTTDIIGEPGTVEDVNYVSDDFIVGGSSSTTAEIQFDPDGAQIILSSSTAATSTITDNSGNDAVRLMESDGEGIEFDFGTAGDVILRGLSSVAELVTALNVTLTGVLDLTSATVNFGADAVDAITEIASGLKSGSDGTLITGTSGTDQNLIEWDANGDAIDSGVAASNVYLADGDTGTGAHDFGGATSFEIPNGASPTVNATGECAWDTTSGQYICYDGSTTNVFMDEWSWGATFASSSLAYDGSYGAAGTTTVEKAGFKYASTLTEIYCEVDTGTSTLRVGDGTNWSELLTCTPTGDTQASPSNGSFTSREQINIEVGTQSGDPNKILLDVTTRWTAD